MDLASLFIVSKVTTVLGGGSGEEAEGSLIPAVIAVKESQDPKCPRCWNHRETVNEEGLCTRCAYVVSLLAE